MAIQRAAAVALDTPEIPRNVRTKYHRRLTKLAAVLRSVGFDAAVPEGTYFLYTKAPKRCAGHEFVTAEDASQFLINQQSVCTVPWDDAGAYLRFSVTYHAPTEAEEDRLMQETAQRLGGLGLVFNN